MVRTDFLYTKVNFPLAFPDIFRYDMFADHDKQMRIKYSAEIDAKLNDQPSV